MSLSQGFNQYFWVQFIRFKNGGDIEVQLVAAMDEEHAVYRFNHEYDSRGYQLTIINVIKKVNWE